jgi:hypothetical protein
VSNPEYLRKGNKAVQSQKKPLPECKKEEMSDLGELPFSEVRKQQVIAPYLGQLDKNMNWPRTPSSNDQAQPPDREAGRSAGTALSDPRAMPRANDQDCLC